MDGGQWKDVLEETVYDLQALKCAVDTICMGLKQERIEPQVIANLVCISNCVEYIHAKAKDAVESDEK